MAADIGRDERALRDDLDFFCADVFQYGLHQFLADTLAFVLLGNLGVRQHDQPAAQYVFDKGHVVSQVEFIALFSGVVY